MNERIKINTTVYSALIGSGKKYSEYKEQAEKLIYKPGDYLVINNGTLSIYKGKIKENTSKELNNHKETIKIGKYNDELMSSNQILTEYEISNLFLKYGKNEQRIERLKGSVLNYFINKIAPKVKLGGDGYLSYVDRGLQRSFLIKFNNNRLKIVGYSKVTTGNPKKGYDKNGSKYWETPCVIIRMPNTIGKWKWKSNPKKGVNIGGYGKRDSRIFWLGNLKYNRKTKRFEFTTKNDKDIGFASHKTSISGEKNLGKAYYNNNEVGSHGCIRNERLMDDICANIEKGEAKKGIQIFQYTIIGDYKKDIVPYIPKLKH